MRKLAIFDVDGTLVDSQALILAAMAQGHAAAGLAMPARDRVLSIVGLSLPIACRRLHPEAPQAAVDALVQGYKTAYAGLRASGSGETAAPFFPGAEAALARLDAAGWLLAIATGKARRGLVHMLNGHAMSDLFVATQTADDAPSKPHPGMVLNVLAATGVAAHRAVMIGDTSFDIEMARAAGAGAVGVRWGYHPAEALVAAGAHSVIDRFDEVDAAVQAALDAAAPAGGAPGAGLAAR
ncbi:MAG: HAD-IA family hydrolase [Pseudomonadota bacterium]